MNMNCRLSGDGEVNGDACPSVVDVSNKVVYLQPVQTDEVTEFIFNNELNSQDESNILSGFCQGYCETDLEIVGQWRQ